jgi:hypothetical protein
MPSRIISWTLRRDGHLVIHSVAEEETYIFVIPNMRNWAAWFRGPSLLQLSNGQIKYDFEGTRCTGLMNAIINLGDFTDGFDLDQLTETT